MGYCTGKRQRCTTLSILVSRGRVVLRLSKMIPVVSKGNKVRWKFDNISALTEDGLYSDAFQNDGVNWKLRVAQYIDSPQKVLDVFLVYASDNREKKDWFCEFDVNVQLINQCGTNKHIHLDYTECWRYDCLELVSVNELMQWDALLEEVNGFLKNDSIIIEAELSFKYFDFSKKIENFTDITIRVRDTDFPVNKGFLCAKSEYFYNLFVNRQVQHKLIELDDIDATDFCFILASFDSDFHLPVGYGYDDVMEAAKLYGVPSLHRICEKFLIDEVDENLLHHQRLFFGRIQYADEYGYEKLLKKCVKSLRTGDDIKRLHANVEFSQLKDATKLKILQRLLDIF